VTAALKAAIELIHVPSRVHAMRASPLPQGTALLLRLAGNDGEAEREAQQVSGRSTELNRRAAIFFIEQILLCSDADSYRTLGSDRNASTADLRAHMALLLKWLHPDSNKNPQAHVLAQRVIGAWEDVKSPERRQGLDAKLRATSSSKLRKKRRTRVKPAAPASSQAAGAATSRGRTRTRRLHKIFGLFFRFQRRRDPA
jgi:hypothetical protein